MYKEFEAKTETEAINKAIEELRIDRENFEVEILDDGKRGLFKRGNVKIRVHVNETFENEEEEENEESANVSSDFENKNEDEEGFDDDSDYSEYEEEEEETLEEDEELEKKLCAFIEGIVEKMGYQCSAAVSSRKGKKLYINIESMDSNIIIGRKGKNLDAIQVLVNVYTGKFDARRKIIVDTESYRVRHEDQIIKNAFRVAMQVKKTGRSRLLEPMNPYERRLVHTALSDVTGIDTKSEGDGILKQIRIFAKRRY